MGGILHVWTVKVLEVVRPRMHESFYPEPVIRRTARPDDLGYFPAHDTVIGWPPPAAAFSAPVEFVALDVFEARIRREYQRAAAGVVALIAPAAKADPVHRRALTDLLVGYLMGGPASSWWTPWPAWARP